MRTDRRRAVPSLCKGAISTVGNHCHCNQPTCATHTSFSPRAGPGCGPGGPLPSGHGSVGFSKGGVLGPYSPSNVHM